MAGLEMNVPEEELLELAKLIESRKVVAINDWYDKPRRTKHGLHRYTSRIFFFPHGIHPVPNTPVEVFRNGLAVWMGKEAQLATIGGDNHSITVVVFSTELPEGDRVQATYTAGPKRS